MIVERVVGRAGVVVVGSLVGSLVSGRGRAGGRSGAVSETVAAVERLDELGGPWPSGGESEPGLAAGAGDHAGSVEEGVAESFRFGSGEVTVEAQQLAPHEQVVGDEGGGQPGLVDLEVG